MSRHLALPRSGTYHLLDTMIDAGYVTHYPDQWVYGLGLSAYELASGYMRQESVQRLARRPLADPADRSGHSAHLSVLHGREVVYVIEERAPGRVRLITDVGARLPAHTTASGRAMLAELPPAQVRALYPSAKDLLGSALPGPRTPIELRRALSDVRSAGVASDEGEVTPGQASLARDGQPITAQLTEEPSRTAVAEQKLGMRRPAVPVLVTENVLDDVIPYAVGRGVAERWWDRGATVRLATNTAPTRVGGALLLSRVVRLPRGPLRRTARDQQLLADLSQVPPQFEMTGALKRDCRGTTYPRSRLSADPDHLIPTPSRPHSRAQIRRRRTSPCGRCPPPRTASSR